MIDARAAAAAGIAAGVVSTLVQLALWAAFTDALPAILWRDARLAAAIVLGPKALGSGAPDAASWIIATIVHFTLSIVYGFALAPLIARRSMAGSIAVGAAFGAVVYAVNMYGFTAAFPWFEAARDAITAATHLVFGASAAVAYRSVADRRRG